MGKQTADLGKPTLLADKLEHGKTQSIRFYQPQIDATRAFIANHPENKFENLTQLYAYLLETASKPAQTAEVNESANTTAKVTELNKEINSLLLRLSSYEETIKQQKSDLELAGKPIEDALHVLVQTIAKECEVEAKPGETTTDILGNLIEAIVEKRVKEKAFAVATESKTGLEILDTHPRLAWFKNFVNDKTENIGDVLLAHRMQSEAAIHQLMLDPMQILEPEDYETLKKWDAEVFVPTLLKRIPPAMLQAYGIEDLAKYLNGAHKFMMMWDFCLNDPAEILLQMGLNLSEEQKEYIANLGFPRMEIVERCLEDISNHKRKLIEQLEKENADVTTELDNAEGLGMETQGTNLNVDQKETGAETGAKVIDITRGAAATNDKADNDN